MYTLAIICACVLTACAAPPPAERRDVSNSQIVKQDSDVGVNGEYHYSFETSDGIKAAQAGELKKIGNEVGGISSGYYEYKGEGGEPFKVTYTADERGFLASGPHIHPIPEPIARALKWAEEHPYKEPERKH